MAVSKYRNVKTQVDGITFHSKKEARRYQDLRLLERAGEIKDLELQPKFLLQVNGMKIATYIADFTYHDKTGEVVEDVKGVRTAAYSMKAKLMKAIHGITVKET